MDKKVQWHPGFVAAMNLELAENRKDLVYEKEYNLNTKPLEIDLLVIKKQAGLELANEIGKLFRGHNIMEYKSPEDHLNIDSFYKAQAYAALYKAYGEKVDIRKADDITVSVVREKRPEGLFRYFREHNVMIEKVYQGIYYVAGKVLFPTQIIVTKELNKENHAWLCALSGNMAKQDICVLLENISFLTEKLDRELADSVLKVSVGANKQIAEELKGDDNMYEALMEIMGPELEKRFEKKLEKKFEKKAEEIRKNEKILSAIENLRDFGHSDDEIRAALKKKYNLSESEMEEYF